MRKVKTMERSGYLDEIINMRIMVKEMCMQHSLFCKDGMTGLIKLNRGKC